jgi:hypothetical protein
MVLNIFLVASARLGEAVDDDGEKSEGAGVSPLTASVGRRGRSPCFRIEDSCAIVCHGGTRGCPVA